MTKIKPGYKNQNSASKMQDHDMQWQLNRKCLKQKGMAKNSCAQMQINLSKKKETKAKM